MGMHMQKFYIIRQKTLKFVVLLKQQSNREDYTVWKFRVNIQSLLKFPCVRKLKKKFCFIFVT